MAKGRNGLGCYSKYPILSATPVKYQSKMNGSIAYQFKIGNDTLLVINNHLESNKIGDSEVNVYQEVMESRDGKKVSSGIWKLMKKMAEAIKVRAKQAETIKEETEKFHGKGIVLCGDFNDTPVSYTHRMMSEGLKDAFVESGNGLGISYNQHRMFFRIDHILLSKNLKAYNCTVDNSIDASDHYPIWCYISLE
jgi:exonuclease III